MKQTGKQVLLLGVVCLLMIFSVACGHSVSDDSSVADLSTMATTAPSIAKGPSFTATVLSVGEDWLLVAADAGSDISGQVRVVTDRVAAFAEGDRITVWHTGQMMPSLPPRLVATDVQKMDH